jgi:5S rRNA maturation endonuclease (ribonuclease M5)
MVRGRLAIPSAYFVARGFSASVLDALDVGHSQKLGKSVVPVHDDAGQTCVGYLTRSEKPYCDQCKKCHDPQEGCGRGERRWGVLKDFPRGDFLYNFAAALRSAFPYVLLVEGAGDVWKATEAGIPAVAATSNGITPKQADKLATLKKTVIIAFDTDENGKKNDRETWKQLRERQVNAHFWSPPKQFHDIGDMPAPEVTRWFHDSRRDQELSDAIFAGLV